MTISRIARPICIMLCVLIAARSGVADEQIQPAPSSPRAAVAPTGAPLKIAVLEGANVVNSITQLRAISPVVEIRDQNDFPVEGATVVFTLPSQGPGGTFAGGGTSFSTRSDPRGQASAPPMVPNVVGRFQINVTATAGARKGETAVEQTNSTGAYIGPYIEVRPWYRKWKVWAIIGGVAATTGIVLALTLGGGSKPANTVVITPGVPVFQ